MEQYAVNRLMRIFKEHYTNITPNQNRSLACTIVDALILKTKNTQKFKTAFWKILWNLKLKGHKRSKKTLDDLFDSKWSTPESFIDATDDELDEECALFRRNIQMKDFRKMENTKRINEMIDTSTNAGGLVCSKCKSNKTEYSLLQCRSGDEGSTAFVYCHNCNRRWKFC